MAGALASLERARKLDPGAAEIPAEIAGYYYRQNRPADAIAAAEQALKIDKDNVEAHNILGTVYSSWADGGVAARVGAVAGLDARRRDRASHRDPEHAADGDQPEPADDARAPAASRRQGRPRGADSREGRGAGAVVAAAVAAPV